MGLLDVFFGGIDVGLGLLDRIVDGKAIEKRYTRVESHSVVKEGFRGKGVGCRVDGSTEVPEYAAASTQIGVALVSGLFGIYLGTLEVEFGAFDGKVVFNGGIDALSEGPHFLSAGSSRENEGVHQGKNKNFEHKTVFHRYCVDFMDTILRTITVNPPDFSIKVGGY